ncbi:putative EF-hand domain-containing protein [Helianthus annuus]|nr:putative EF-hand domain-containing protein [Helianthus annuus]
MGLKNLFNRKTKKIKNHKTTDETNPTNNTTPPVISHEQELEQVFNKFDVNGDGKISSSELGSIMGSMGHQPTPEELENMIMQVDADGDGFIDLKEFIELNTKDNGSITADELQKVLGSLGEECTVGECRKMIAGVDQDGDGMISFDEFKVMMMSGSMFNDLI